VLGREVVIFGKYTISFGYPEFGLKPPLFAPISDIEEKVGTLVTAREYALAKVRVTVRVNILGCEDGTL